MNILVTGTAGFIGFHLVQKLSGLGHKVTGIDNINDYYDVNLKYARLKQSGINKDDIEYGKKVQSSSINEYSFLKLDLTDREKLFSLINEEQFDCICNLAAQAGVSYSLENPFSYIDSNINGFINILEACRQYKIKYLVFASSSSVYGLNDKVPFSESDRTDQPISLYAATKKSNELMAFTYSNLFKIPCTGLRFFTVYGPWGRPDMAYYKFTKAILNNETIYVNNRGKMSRDFTYIDDIVNGVISALNNIPDKNNTPFELYNLGNNKPENLLDFIEILEKHLGRKANKEFLGMPPGEVSATMADIDKTRSEFCWEPKTNINDGLRIFTEWFLEYNDIS